MATAASGSAYSQFAATCFDTHLYSFDYDTDGAIWLPAIGGGMTTIGGTWTATRDAAGMYRLAKTAAANTTYVVFDLSQLLLKQGNDPALNLYSGGKPPVPTTGQVPTNVGRHILRGFQLTKVDVVTSIGTADLTSATPLFQTTTFAAGATQGSLTTAANAFTGSITITHTATTLAVDTLTITTPYVVGKNTADIADYLEIQIVDPGTAVFSIYGVYCYGNYQYN